MALLSGSLLPNVESEKYTGYDGTEYCCVWVGEKWYEIVWDGPISQAG